MTVRKGNCSNGQRGAEDDLELGKRSRPKTREKTEGEKKRDWCEDERSLSESRYSRDGSWTGCQKVT
jgi:hypothetical protein